MSSTSSISWNGKKERFLNSTPVRMLMFLVAPSSGRFQNYVYRTPSVGSFINCEPSIASFVSSSSCKEEVFECGAISHVFSGAI